MNRKSHIKVMPHQLMTSYLVRLIRWSLSNSSPQNRIEVWLAQTMILKATPDKAVEHQLSAEQLAITTANSKSSVTSQVKAMHHVPIIASLLNQNHTIKTMNVQNKFLKMQEQDQERCKGLSHQKETAMKGQVVLLKGCLREEKEVTQHHLFQKGTSQPKHKHMHSKKIFLESSIRLLLSMKIP